MNPLHTDTYISKKRIEIVLNKFGAPSLPNTNNPIQSKSEYKRHLLNLASFKSEKTKIRFNQSSTKAT